MSWTATTTRSRQRAGSILLSPSKRRWLSEEEKNRLNQRPSAKEIWEWTLTSAAVAKCYVRDTMVMPENEEGYDFFWLGSIPCRKVEILAIVVGIQVLEKKIIYTVDDGTSVIDCVHVLRQFKRSMETNKYAKPPEPLQSPRPMSQIGGVVNIIGKVQPKHESRVILVDEITSSSCGEQLDHWKAVRDLHGTRYFSSEPFVIPITPNGSKTPSKSQRNAKEAQTPSMTVVSSQTAILNSSPIAPSPTTIPSSPIKPNPETQSPPKLRHPLRLRSHNLTDAAFRLYLKHFLDNAPEDPVRIDSDDFDDFDIYSPERRYTSHILDTPTKSRRYIHGDLTPKHNPKMTPKPSSSTIDVCKGFTLSYLRRVPELSLMAKRVVKQRARAEDKKARTAVPQSSAQTSSKWPIKRIKLDKPGLAAKKKRLFQWAICELLREGSIVLWDGPKRPYQGEKAPTNAIASVLWRDNSTMTTVDNTLFSNAGSSKLDSTADEEDDLDPSDPETDEEAYVSTKPELLASSICDALRALAVAPKKRALKRNELLGGSTKDDILGYLRRDDRWRFIGEWNIADALEYMDKEHMAWCIGENKWIATE